MIKSFKDKDTERLYYQEPTKWIPRTIAKVALRKLLMINAAESLADLSVPPGNRLEMLRGDREGQWSIRINDKWRIVFVPIGGGYDYEEVEIVDYH